jgi:hypothetical protein
MTPNPTVPTDDELRDLLDATFAAHEHLADPERAVAIATAPSPTSHRGRVLLAVAAAVALVAGGTAYAVSQGSGTSAPDAGPATPSSGGVPPLPPLQTDAGNRAAAVRAAETTAAALPVVPGARETDSAGVPELGDDTLSSLQPPGHTVLRSRFWSVSGVRSKAVVTWYAAHPPAGFHTEGGPAGVGGQGDGTTWIDEVYWDGPQGDRLAQTGTSVEVQTTATASGVGIRLTVSSLWPPARPVASFVQDVSSIDVRSTHEHYGRSEHTTHRSFTVTDPAQVLRAAVAFNRLPGMTPVLHSCPMLRDVYTDRIVIHTATGDVTAVNTSSLCGSGMTVARNGTRVPPALGDASRLLQVLGLRH